MDPQVENVIEAILNDLEAEFEKEKEKKRQMEESLRADEESLRADEAALEKKEIEFSTLVAEMDQRLAFIENGENLVQHFLEADAENDFDAQNALMPAIVALLENGDGGQGRGLEAFYGGGINHPENAEDLDEEP